MKQATLVFLIDKFQARICLGMKKRGFGVNRWNGYGGKLVEGETVLEAAVREITEETRADESSTGVTVNPTDLEKVALLDFHFPEKDQFTGQQVHVFLCYKWEGIPQESEEMKPEWFKLEDIPYDQMWPDDIYWLPKVLTGDQVLGEFIFDSNDNILEHRLEIIEENNEGDIHYT